MTMTLRSDPVDQWTQWNNRQERMKDEELEREGMCGERFRVILTRQRV